MIPIKLNYPKGFDNKFADDVSWFANFVRKYGSNDHISQQLLLMATDEYHEYLNYLGSISSIVVEAFGGCCAYCDSTNIISVLPIHPIDQNRDFPELVQELKNILPLCRNCRKIVTAFKYLVPFLPIDAPVKFEMLSLKKPDVLIPTQQATHLSLRYNKETGKIEGLTKLAKKTINVCAINRAEKVKERIEFFSKVLPEITDYANEDYWYLWKSLKNNRKNIIKDLSFAEDLSSEWELLSDYINNESLICIEERILNSKVKIEESDKYVELLNFNYQDIRNINDGKIQLSGSKSIGIVGENGVGKSTILNFLSVAVRGTRKHIVNRSSDGFINEKSRKASGTLSGFERVYFDNTVTITKQDGNLFHCNTNIENRLKIAYINESRIQSKNIESADKWLLGLAVDNFNIVASQLKQLLDIEYDSTLVRKEGEVFIHVDGGANKDISAWSSGYMSILSIIYNIYKQFGTNYTTSNQLMNVDSVAGVVFIDEIDLHLHPRWKINIVSRLKRVFPDILFIFTTHDPLVLKGCSKGELILIKRKIDGTSELTQELPDISYYNAERILTSRYFGLSSSSNIKDNDDLLEFYQSIRGEDRESILANFSSLKKNGLYGTTYREMIAFMCVDKSLALDKPIDVEEIVKTINIKISEND